MKKTTLAAIGIALSCLLSACGGSTKTPVASTSKTKGAISAVMSIDHLMANVTKSRSARSSALLGIYLSQYLSTTPSASAAGGALLGIGVQSQVMSAQQQVQDPDFELLQAFADALQVDVSDLLNRSTDRQVALDTYTEALTNVATRANDRFKELNASLDQQKEELRTLSKEKSQADRDLKKAIADKDFANAGELQKAVTEKQSAYAAADLNRKQLEDLIKTLDQLLTVYGEKILAIQKNREALISGTKVVDVPGIDDLNLIERQRRSSRTGGFGASDAQFDVLFEGM